MSIDIEAPIPILRIFDLPKMREFYLDYLGFSVDWEHRFEPALPLYLQISRGRARLHLSEHHGDGTPGTALFVPCKGIEALAADLSAKAYGYARPAIEHAPWKARTLTVTDPFGNRLIFNEPD
ncbi:MULTISPECIES: glyoxalase superfamily protein [unclassified Aureimonas]|uniref:glyoxalase superfamily protein n=1 Tax=unclassified Aureimonas TaxID=2615206 RepID=UPI0006F3986C|nr:MULTISPECIES: glyoxalase superfamily protein [unclassified Aureimonas]KQT53987.1 hypothetical protein ASG62_12235 [Aureimonas sp. Leaf427]KQT71573.1 hypothetical protein ASG54_18925 [Aureimonas sp. Leaf460]